MKFSQLFIQTLKEAPKDAVLKSHQFLIRAGYIEQVGSGIYNFLPLGKKVLDKISTIIKEEMDKAGAQEVLLGFVTPAKLWKSSGRYDFYGDELLRFKDRKDNEFVLGPTHEEMITNLAKNFIKSYKQLPINLYQINTKFRDERRPRFGLMRGREFIMKDAYSFHAESSDLDKEFDNMEKAYKAIFKRLGLEIAIVEADSGAIGGSGSKEFMVLAPSGEDTIAMCKNCGYAANVETAKRQIPTSPLNIKYSSEEPKAKFARFHTPSIKDIESLSEFFKVDSFFILKAVVKKALRANGKNELVCFFVRGDDSAEEVKMLNTLNSNGGDFIEIADVELDSNEFAESGLCAGFVGAYNLEKVLDSKYIYFDNALKDASFLICGANEKDYHFVGFSTSMIQNAKYADIARIRQGDKCECGSTLTLSKGIEVGHIFKLGTKYSKAMEATFLDKDGRAQDFIMGCYGIGVSRLLPAILEQKADELGCVWSEETNVFELVIIISNIKDSAQFSYANEIYENLKKSGISVLLDERDLRFGAKIKDFELIGFGAALIVGKGLENGEIEFIKRDGLQKQILESCNATKQILKLLRGNDE